MMTVSLATEESSRFPKGSETTTSVTRSTAGSREGSITEKVQVYATPLGIGLLFGAAVAATIVRNTLVFFPAPEGHPLDRGSRPQSLKPLLKFLQGPTVESSRQDAPPGKRPTSGLILQAEMVSPKAALSKMMSF